MTQDLSLRSKGEKVKKIYRKNFDIWDLSCDFWCLRCRNHFLIREVLGLPWGPEPPPAVLVSCALEDSHGENKFALLSLG